MNDDAYRIGIDFGTSNTVAVYTGPGGQVHPLVFDGSPTLPSAVCLNDTGGLLVGPDAVHAARVHPESYEPHPKRRIDEDVALLGGREIPVADMIAAVLRRVVTEARRVTGHAPGRAFLTYPAAWAQTRRGRLAAAAERAGLTGITLIPEPVAGAASFLAVAGAAVRPGACVVVYDLGGGTFDASVVRHGPGGFEVLSTEGLEEAGGLDVDAAVIEYFGTVFAPRHEAAWRRLTAPATPVDRRAHRLLWEDVRTGKEMLSRTSSTVIHLPLIEEDAPLGRGQFDELARPILDRTVRTTRSAIATAGIAMSEVAGIFLVGGASRMPLVATLLHQAFGTAPTILDQPELVVARGSLTIPDPAASARPVAGPAVAGPVSGPPAEGPGFAGSGGGRPGTAGTPAGFPAGGWSESTGGPGGPGGSPVGGSGFSGGGAGFPAGGPGQAGAGPGGSGFSSAASGGPLGPASGGPTGSTSGGPAAPASGGGAFGGSGFAAPGPASGGPASGGPTGFAGPVSGGSRTGAQATGGSHSSSWSHSSSGSHTTSGSFGVPQPVSGMPGGPPVVPLSVPPVPGPMTTGPMTGPVRPAPSGPYPAPPRRRSSNGPWILVAVLVVVLVCVSGLFVLMNLGGDDDPTGDRAGDVGATRGAATRGPAGTPGSTAGAAPTSAPWIGRWAGPIKQGSQSYDIDVTLKGGAVNAVIGEVAYDPLNCSGIWTLTAATDQEVRAKETITNDPKRTCVATTLVAFRPMDANRILVQIYTSMGYQADPIASGILSRK
ncbi:Hsp70 family protein [Virgisporangium aliadipatigenens]|uniref:Hsp70 family protein n=1 Tax=Virgisporangium aliadipatigenens TaxID=741659 RepID=UPI0019408878|nr:Hsp70 family protein [Virgisporangium aliadipatigenens]